MADLEYARLQHWLLLSSSVWKRDKFAFSAAHYPWKVDNPNDKCYFISAGVQCDIGGSDDRSMASSTMSSQIKY